VAQKPTSYGNLPSEVFSPERRFPTSIDKIRLFCPFKVADRFDDFMLYTEFEIYPRNNQGDIVLFQHRGEDIRGVFALWRDGHLRVRIGTPFPRGKDVFCWLTFNPSQVLHGVNTRPVTKREFRDVLHQVQQRLKARGLLLDLYKARLSQLDLCRDISLPRPVSSYWPLLHRTDTANNARPRNFRTGLWRGNKSTRWCFYDKEQEVRAKSRRRGVNPEVALEFLPGSHTMRLERRLRDAATVKREAKTETIQQLLHSYNSLSGLLDQRLLRGVFREPEPTSSALDTTWLSSSEPGEAERWEVMLRSAAVQEAHLKNLLAIQGYEHLIKTMDWLGADALLWAEFTSKDQAPMLSKMRKKFRQWRLTYGISRQGVPYAQFYAELYRATFAPQTDDVEEQDRLIAALLPFKPLPIIRGSNR